MHAEVFRDGVNTRKNDLLHSAQSSWAVPSVIFKKLQVAL